MRKKIVAGNWKMNLTPSEGVVLITEIHKQLIRIQDRRADVVICPPFTTIDRVVKALLEVKGVFCGAQDCHQELSGAYTGEISARMLHEMGARYVILGHSERRKYHAETDELINKKIKTALSEKLTIIYCCGETLEERETGKHFEVVEQQIKTALFDLTPEQFVDIIIAYEPVWAIGTGHNATPEQAQEIHSFIRSLISEKFGAGAADNLSILYGGSCKPSNAESLFSQPDIDGGLIGGASLDADQFVEIVMAI